MTDLTLPDGRIMTREAFDAAWTTLSKPFPTSEIEKLPKQMKRDDSDKGKCVRGSRYSGDDHYCGGWHARSIHLDYVGHAGITMRLNEADPFWTWEPMSLTEHGTPRMTDDGLWIKLTVLGITRIGYGDPAGKRGANAVKEVIGDALRNAAMRFGVATYLWSKSEAAAELKTYEEPQQPATSVVKQPLPRQSPQPSRDWLAAIYECESLEALTALGREARDAGAMNDELQASFRNVAAALKEPQQAPSGDGWPTPRGIPGRSADRGDEPAMGEHMDH